MPEREKRIFRIVRQVFLLFAHSLHRGWQLKGQFSLRCEFPKDDVQHCLIACTEIANERCAFFGDLWNDRRTFEINIYHRWHLIQNL